mgnify:FL=1
MGNRSLAVVKKSIILLVVLLALAAALLAAAATWLQHWADSPMPFTTEQTLEVPAGSSLYRLSQELERGGLIEHGRYLRWYSRLHDLGHLVQAGEYRLAVGTTPHQLIEKIAAGDVVQYAVTLINGHTFAQFRQTLAADPVLEQRLPEMTVADILAALGEQREHPEGLFYPDTYQFRRGDSDLDVLVRAYQRMQALLHQAWQDRAPDLPYTTPYEALIMASIVEKETAVPAERAEIAGVFVNRLRRNMRLQTDPTVIYGLGSAFDGNLTRAHLRASNPYNTYRIRGLPPTPIANPALPAIEAALHPATTEALYFVAKGDGSHQFSRTLQQHQQAVRRYQHQRRADYRSSPAPGSANP